MDAEFCQFCQMGDLIIEIATETGEGRKWTDIDHHTDAGALISASENCTLCSTVLQSFPDDELELIVANPASRLKSRLGTYDGGRGMGAIVFTCCRLENNFVDGKSSKVYILRGTPVRDSSHFTLSTGSVQNLDQIKSWLKTCVSEHDTCLLRKGNKPPTRLITTTPGAARLVLSSQLPEQPRYAALSHCWGKTRFLTLKKSNFEEFQSRVPAAALSKTFEHALLVANHLGIEFLWVDSLCIIQDDKDDWDVESARMCDIYGQSFINISAMGAQDGTVGCFFERSARTVAKFLVKRATIKYKTVNGTPATFDFSIASANIYHEVMRNAPLGRRAWCFQERFLAARTVHFARGQIFWECSTCRACESFPDGVPQQYRAVTLKPEGDRIKRLLSRNMIGNSMRRKYLCRVLETNTAARYSLPETTFQDLEGLCRSDGSLASLWSMIVEYYSGANLTKQSDKLVALSGVARWLSELNHDQYRAGLWHDKLEIQLLWQVRKTRDQNESNLCRPSEYQAPSWSWASINRPVEYETACDIQDRHEPNETWFEHIFIVDASVETCTASNPFGQVRAGRLRVDYEHLMTERPDDAEVSLDYPRGTMSGLYYLPVHTCHDHEHTEFCFTRGIVLESAAPQSLVFQRVGYYKTTDCMASISLKDGGWSQRKTHKDKQREEYLIII